MSEVYSILVGQAGIDPRYFLDDMTFYEMSLALKGFGDTLKLQWEWVALISYYSGVPNLKDEYPKFREAIIPGEKETNKFMEPDVKITSVLVDHFNKVMTDGNQDR